jgi:TolA-binding protein
MATTMAAPEVKSSPKNAPPTAPAAWLSVPKNRALAGGIGLAAVLLITWFAMVSSQRKAEFAGRALEQARGAAEAGNLPLAASELQKVISTYAGTDAAQEAVITLNQVRLVNGQQQLAVVALQDFLKTNPKSKYQAPGYGLLGRALENSSRPEEAAKAFLSASKAADSDYLRAEYLIDAGRAFTNAGKKDDAIGAYRQVLKEYPKTSAKVEAEVRLAELTQGKM